MGPAARSSSDARSARWCDSCCASRPTTARARLDEHHDLDALAADNLVQYLAEQHEATGAVPDDRTIVIERVRDELGDWRVCLLSPFGAQVLAPWAMAVSARLRDQLGLDVETMWADDGFVVRFPETDEPPDPLWLVPDADEIEALVIRQLGATSLFAARFRECAGRALLLPRRRPGRRAPLWQQRKRAAGPACVSRRDTAPSRSCSRPTASACATCSTSRRWSTRCAPSQSRQVRVVQVDTPTPSPFAASLLFGYVANYLYDGDAPLAERRAQALDRSIRRNCRRCWGRPNCGSCSTPTRWRRSRRSCSACLPTTARGRSMASTICCCASAIFPRRSCAIA